MPTKNAPAEAHAYAAAECARDILASVASPSDVRRLDFQTLAMLRARGAALTVHLENLTRAIEREAELVDNRLNRLGHEGSKCGPQCAGCAMGLGGVHTSKPRPAGRVGVRR